jgi:ABC-type Mn2+/Zn2+ transport system ATPase subunit
VIGLAVMFGVMGVINMAHGEMVMLGACTVYAVQEFRRTRAPHSLDVSLAFAIPPAFLGAAAVGALIERTVTRFPHGRPLETLLASFHPAKLSARTAGELSHGQQQWLEIGMLLAQHPALLLVDEPVAGMTDAETEPTEGIQPSIIKDISRVIDLPRARGSMAIILVERYLDFASAPYQDVAAMDRGAIVLKGPLCTLDAADIRHRPTV